MCLMIYTGLLVVAGSILLRSLLVARYGTCFKLWPESSDVLVKKHLNGPAVKEGSTYRYDTSTAPVFAPNHPNHTKSAFVCVTTSGLLRLLWPQNNNKWHESHTELESILSSDDLITHAAICTDKSKLQTFGWNPCSLFV